MQQLRDRIARVAPSEAAVLILGERGTGKELVADAIQRGSRRREQRYEKINCAALPMELLASELFGHERGAFTGAVERRAGLLSVADGGTVLLDEVGDLSLPAQAMLLRFLQEGEVRPVGGRQTRRLNVRVIAATNRDLERATERGEFRADLLDRLGEVVLHVPSLRDRRGDIPLLVQHFLRLHSRRHGAAVPHLPPAALQCLAQGDWPGNVRELSTVVSRAVLFAGHDAIRVDNLRDGRGERRADPEPSDTPGPSRLTASRRQREALRLATRRCGVRRADLISRFGISGEAARLDLTALVRAGWLCRTGSGRGSMYVITEIASAAARDLISQGARPLIVAKTSPGEEEDPGSPGTTRDRTRHR